MRIVADENIPLVAEFFNGWGSLIRRPGRTLCSADLAHAEVLLVRSVTSVNAALLAETPVAWVGTCTIGTDHLDQSYLQHAGIPWASAPGCNAQGVVDYVLGCLLALAEKTGGDLATRCYGIVGVGQVGGRLAQVLAALGWRVLLCDPPRQAQEGGAFTSLEHILSECDVISLHTTLTLQGADATHHLLNAERLQALRPNSWLINASRGPVVDNAALLRHLTEHPNGLQVVLDVWEGEPQVNQQLVPHCQIATPHIAGYSLEGKMRGTEAIYRACCRWQNRTVQHQLSDFLPPPALTSLSFSSLATPSELLSTLCRAVYDPRRDDVAFRQMLLHTAPNRLGEGFDFLRKNYPVRREVTGLEVVLAEPIPSLVRVVRALGAQLCQTARPC